MTFFDVQTKLFRERPLLLQGSQGVKEDLIYHGLLVSSDCSGLNVLQILLLVFSRCLSFCGSSFCGSCFSGSKSKTGLP